MDSASTSSSTSNGTTGGMPTPAPMPAANSPPPFLVKTYEMVDDSSTDKIVSWSAGNNSFVVWDAAEFAKELLPKHFKHSNFSSFVRQLNTYGFRKVDPDRWEFANEGFLRGQKHLLKNITRRKPVQGHAQQPQALQQPSRQTTSVTACVEVGKFGLEEEVEQLKRDKNVLMQELVRLRQQQQTTDGQLQTMVQRLQGMEQRQQQMMSFLAKAVNNPGFLAQFMPQQNDTSRRITEGSKKRRLKQDRVSEDNINTPVDPSDGQIVKYQPLMNEAAKAMLRQIIKMGSSPVLENFGNNSSDGFLIGDGSSESMAMECTSPGRVSQVTLQEVPPTISGPTFPEIQQQFLGPPADVAGNQFVGMVPENNNIDNIIGTEVVDIVGTEIGNGVFVDPTANNGKFVLELGGISSPDPNMEWDGSLLADDIYPELPDVGDPFWEKFLQDDETETEDLQDESKNLENGWEKSQNMENLTEQMGHLSSHSTKQV